MKKKKLIRWIITQDKFFFSSNLQCLNQMYLQPELIFFYSFFLFDQFNKFCHFLELFGNFYCFNIKKSFFFSLIEVKLKTSKIIIKKKRYLLYRSYSTPHCFILIFFDILHFFIGYLKKLSGCIYYLYMKKLSFLEFFRNKYIIYKKNFIKIIVVLNAFVNYTSVIFSRTNRKLLNKSFKKIQTVIIKLEEKTSGKSIINCQKLKKTLLYLYHEFKKTLNCILLKYDSITTFFFDFYFILLVRSGFRFYNKNATRIQLKKLKNSDCFFAFLTSFLFFFKFKKKIKEKTLYCIREIFFEIYFFNKKSLKFWFFLLKKKNYQVFIYYCKFCLNKHRIEILKKIKHTILLFYKKKNLNYLIINDHTKWSSIHLLKKNYFLIEKKNVFFFFCLLVPYWKNFIENKVFLYENFFLIEFLFKVREIFFICYSLYFFHYLNIISLSSILKKQNFKKKLVEYIYLALEFILEKSEKIKFNNLRKYIYLISKEVISFVTGGGNFFNIQYQFIKDRLVIFLYNFSKDHKKYETKSSSIFNPSTSTLCRFGFYFQKRHQICNSINKFAKNLNHLFFNLNLKIVGLSKNKIKNYTKNIKDQLSSIKLSINIKLIINNFAEIPQKSNNYLPISIFRSFRNFSRAYFFYKNKQKIINWKFNLARFLIQFVGFVCYKLKLLLICTTFEQMLIYVSFNSNLILFKKDLKFLLGFIKLKTNLPKKKNYKTKFLEIMDGKKIQNVEFLVLKKFFTPIKSKKRLPFNLDSIFPTKKLVFSDLKNYIDKESLYLCQSLIIKILKKKKQLKIDKLLILIKKKMHEHFKSDPRGIKIQLEDLNKKEYLRILYGKKGCKYI
nr:ubiquitin-protein ligase (Cullin) isoform 1 [Cryptomonas curvata]